VKKTTLISFGTAIFGLLWIIYCHARVRLEYEKGGAISELVTFYTYRNIDLAIITLTQLIGLTFALTQAFKFKRKINLLAALCCLINLILVWV